MKIAFTIVTNSYLAHAKALRESLLAHNPDYQFWIGLLDAPLPTEEAQGVLTVGELGIADFDALSETYTPFELSCLLKPFFASYFLAQGADLALYLDSDILVWGSFHLVEQASKQYAFLLTPHLLQARNGNENTELSLLRTGIYNGGFFVANNSPASLAFLSWWKDRLRRYCFDKAGEGLFVDQLWLNFLPAYCPNYSLIRDAGYNVAYWNLPERGLGRQDAQYTANGAPLVFFHYSGYRFAEPEKISRHAEENINFEQYPQTRALFARYEERVKAHGWDAYKGIEPHFGKKIIEVPPPPPPKKKGYFSVLWRAIRGEIALYAPQKT